MDGNKNIRLQSRQLKMNLLRPFEQFQNRYSPENDNQAFNLRCNPCLRDFRGI